MGPDTWRKVKSVLERASVLTPSERSAFLDEACGDDVEMRKEVESLLATEIPTDFMESAPVAAAPGPRFRPGDTVDSYRILQEIGRGGMGVVYRVVHTGLDREFALKTLKVSPAASLGIERFEREAKVLGSLKHPNIVDVTDFGVLGDMPYLVMELVTGSSLRERCSKLPSADEGIRILSALALAVDHAHEKGVLHGDLKPDNVVLSGDDCKVLDFGLAAMVRPETSGKGRKGRTGDSSPPADDDVVTQLGTTVAVAGTPSYMAPELFSGSIPSIATDVYSLGVVAYEVLAGRRPFTLTREVLTDGWPPAPRPSTLNPALPEEIDEPLMAAVSQSAVERPSSATDFVERLRTALARGRSRIHRRTQFPRRLAASVGVVLVVSLSSCSLWSTRWCRSMENRVLDAKWSLLPTAPPSPEILLVTVDDRWIAAQSRSLSQQGDLFGERLSSLFSAGARAIAFDIVLPTEWSEAEEFTRLVLSHADRLTLAAFGSFTDGTIRGRECIHPLTASLLGPDRLESLFGLVNLEADEDGAVRKSRWGFTDREGRVHLSWAARAARTLRENVPARNEFYLDQSAPLDSVASIGFLDLPAALESSPDLVRGKLLVLGATFEGSADTFRAIDEKGEERSLPGAYVQANLVRTLVSGVQLKEVGNLALLAVCSILVAAAATPVILHASPLVSWLAPLAVLLLFAAASFAAFRAFHVQIPTAGPMVSFGIAIAGALAMRRALR